MKELMDRAFENLRNMSPEQFEAAMKKAESTDICRELNELDEFSEYLLNEQRSALSSSFNKGSQTLDEATVSAQAMVQDLAQQGYLLKAP